MSQLQNLEKLMASGRAENVDLVKMLVESPRLAKAKGILKRCGMSVYPPRPNDNQGLMGQINWMHNERPCNCQARVICTCCKRAVCKTHFKMDVMECSECGGRDRHFYMNMNPTETYTKRMWARHWLSDEAGMTGKMELSLPQFKYRNPNWRMTAAAIDWKTPEPQKKAKTREKKPKHNPKPSRMAFLDGLGRNKKY